MKEPTNCSKNSHLEKGEAKQPSHPSTTDHTLLDRNSDDSILGVEKTLVLHSGKTFLMYPPLVISRPTAPQGSKDWLRDKKALRLLTARLAGFSGLQFL